MDGFYICVKFVVTAANKLIRLKRKCDKPALNSKYNLKAYAERNAPKSFKGWSYPRLQSSDKMVPEIVLSQGDLSVTFVGGTDMYFLTLPTSQKMTDFVLGAFFRKWTSPEGHSKELPKTVCVG